MKNPYLTPQEELDNLMREPLEKRVYIIHPYTVTHKNLDGMFFLRRFVGRLNLDLQEKIIFEQKGLYVFEIRLTGQVRNLIEYTRAFVL